ncbi:GNAT family N-acetyltransferase [Leuconostoc carnosum]|uniref:GNAT family N-acetyltransferase n=1 Tax=Leuconostoc carnosum TaxID=1252 RepID=UPI00123AD754|nr:GNAT family N-acetyltransferase [Leuconostoc carnosum]KAA8369498.1 GNAT family N-acetyltransferase [Leuconostoc carnosum]KAA8380516.1 GNAT family N-acetyltransferase [Leuconostoc carnosum]
MIKQKKALANNHLKLRAMRPDDATALARIYLDTRLASFPWVKNPRLEDFVTVTQGEHVQVAIIEEEIVGFASLSEEDSFLHLLFIKEGWQNQGIGQQLLTWARQEVRRPLELKVVRINKRAQQFYKREGFKIIATSILANPANVTYRDDRNS